MWSTAFLALFAVASGSGRHRTPHAERAQLGGEQLGALGATLPEGLGPQNAGGGASEEIVVADLLRLVDQEKSSVLRDFWEGQPRDRLLVVHNYAVKKGAGWDLEILQPNMFGMDCARVGGRTETSHREAFHNFIKSISPPDGLKILNKEYRSSLDIRKVAETIRKMAENARAESLKPAERDLLQLLAEGRGLSKDDATSCHAGYMIFNETDRYALAVLDDWLWVFSGPHCVWFKKVQMHYFPPTCVTKHLVKQGVAPAEYVEHYAFTIRDILNKPLRMNDVQWSMIEPELRKEGLTYLGVDTFSQLLTFLEDNPQYGGLFGIMIWWGARSRGSGMKELEPAGLEVLIRTVIDDSDKESRHAKLNSIAAHIARAALGEGHPYFEERFAPIHEQLNKDLSTIFKDSSDIGSSLDRYILSIPAEMGESSGLLYDLQVTVVTKNAYFLCESDVSHVDREALENTLREYGTKQLANIYESHWMICSLFKQSQLRESDPDLFKFDNSVDEKQIFALLSKIYRKTHSGSNPAFNWILDNLSRGLGAEWPFSWLLLKVPRIFWALPSGSDLLGNSDGCWLKVELDFYEKCGEDTRDELVRWMGIDLALEFLERGGEIDTKLYKTFDEALEGMVGPNKSQQLQEEQPALNNANQQAREK